MKLTFSRIYGAVLVLAVLFIVGWQYAHADEVLPPPQAYKLVTGNPACISSEQAIAQLGKAIDRFGGRGFALIKGVQQRFADIWRERLGLPSVAVSMILLWQGPLFTTVSEIDPSDCWSTITTMPTAKAHDIMDEVAKTIRPTKKNGSDGSI